MAVASHVPGLLGGKWRGLGRGAEAGGELVIGLPAPGGGLLLCPWGAGEPDRLGLEPQRPWLASEPQFPHLKMGRE